MLKIRNHKSQTIPKFEIRNSKFETRLRFWSFGIVCHLSFVIWNLLQPLPLFAACDPKAGKICNPLDTAGNLVDIIGFVIKTILPISGAVALLMLIVGAIYWIISGGASEQVQKGKDTVVWALLGAVVILGSYVALSFILRALTTGVPGYQQGGASPPVTAPPAGP